jgi:hypothetical protein
LSKVLPPEAVHKPVEPRTEPRRPVAPATIEVPSLPLPPAPVAMPHLPAGKPTMTLVPRSSLPETPIASLPEPHAQPLPPGELMRMPSVDVNRPIPLAILGMPSSDRAPVEDVTTDASNAAAVATTMPQRTQPAPFVKNNLPDPFEFRRPIAVPPPLVEQPTPPATTPRLPK